MLHISRSSFAATTTAAATGSAYL